MDKTKSSTPETKPQTTIQDLNLEIEELEHIVAPKLAVNHNETFARPR